MNSGGQKKFINKFFKLHAEIKNYMRNPHVIDYMRPQLHAETCNLHADCDYMRWPHVKLHGDYLQCIAGNNYESTVKYEFLID